MKKLLFVVLCLAGLASAQTVNTRTARVTVDKLASVTTSSTFDVSRLAPSKHTVAVVPSGSPTGCSIKLEGSLDGTTWFDLSGAQTCTSNVMVHVVDKPVDYVRVNLTALSGGTSPSVTVSYLGVY